nr:hypothetical protein [Marinicella sp. W31]MDC2877402.1 hypothetical protein [Marinicella sp. W31]
MLRADLEQLIEEGTALAQDKAAAEKALSESRQMLDALENEAGEGHLVDPAPLRRRYEALRPDIVRLGDIEALETEIAQKERSLSGSAAGLRPAIADIFTLTRADLPTAVELRRHRDQVTAAVKAHETCKNALLDLADEEARLGKLLDADGDSGRVPTREAILEARAHRDSLFRSFADAKLPAQPYAEAVEAADLLADSALDDAERVARHAEAVKRLEETRQSHETMTQHCGEAASALDLAHAEYRAVFARLAIEPGAPEEMLEWLRSVDALLLEREALLLLKDKHGLLQRLQGELQPAVSALARDMGADADMPAIALSRQIETALNRLSERWSGAREREGQRLAARQAIEARKAELAGLEARKADFEERYAAVLVRFGLPEGTGLAAARAALAVWVRVPPLLATRERLSRETANDETLIARFEAEARALAETVAPDIASDVPNEIVRRLAGRVETHATRAARRETLVETAAALERELAALQIEQGLVKPGPAKSRRRCRKVSALKGLPNGSSVGRLCVRSCGRRGDVSTRAARGPTRPIRACLPRGSMSPLAGRSLKRSPPISLRIMRRWKACVTGVSLAAIARRPWHRVRALKLPPLPASPPRPRRVRLPGNGLF